MKNNASQDLLASLLGTVDDKVKISLNKTTSGIALVNLFNSLQQPLPTKLINDNDYVIAKNIALHPNCPASLLLKLISLKRKPLATASLSNGNIPKIFMKSFIEKILVSKKIAKIYPLLKNPNFPWEYLSQLEDFKDDENIQEFLAEHSSNIQLLEELILLKSIKVQISLIMNPNTTSIMLKKLAKDWWHNNLLLNHKNVTEEILIICRKQKEKYSSKSKVANESANTMDINIQKTLGKSI